MAQNRHVHIANDLRRHIKCGTYAPGTPIPAESALMEQYRASRPTVRIALAQIENEGLLIRIHGRGNFVRHQPGLVTYDTASRVAGGCAVMDTALQVSVSKRATKAKDDVAASLGVPVGSVLTEYRYQGHYLTDPYSLALIYVPHAVAVLEAPTHCATPTGEDIREALSRAGVHVVETRTRVVSRLPNQEETKTLAIGAGAPLMEIQRVSVDAESRIVELARIVLPGFSAEAVFTESTRTRELEAA
ncbi:MULTISPECIES: GntR family transcriptional regulator [Streptomyces]|uniref:GntR family transcriptional regulator n=1 Tax=Streptomyces TaxID=1883 RepID=UPI001E3972A5|nr:MULTISPECIES: GntR family transcriptional regulator [Streptomyces]UFQ16868.1 GntR family transcriptional regulator [Streptomyces huasconensis]WCL86471.1 GntR family transcriptional regulator [Streptomyces sp. JCM 35825]